LLAVTNAADKARRILARIFGKIGMVAHRFVMTASLPSLNSKPAPQNFAEPDPVLALAQQLAQQLSLKPDDWHRLKSNRRSRALEQTAVALVYLLKDEPEEALARLQQAAGWLDRSISAPPCPTHGHSRPSASPAKDV
jgi:Family of unknown function (DUF6439)